MFPTCVTVCFQFLGIPPKGERFCVHLRWQLVSAFPISRDPPEGGTPNAVRSTRGSRRFPISRDPPEGGTTVRSIYQRQSSRMEFPISRDPPEGGTVSYSSTVISRAFPFPISRDPPEGGTSCYS